MARHFMSGTRYAAFERMMTEVPNPPRHPEQRKKPHPREKKAPILPKDPYVEVSAGERGAGLWRAKTSMQKCDVLLRYRSNSARPVTRFLMVPGKVGQDAAPCQHPGHDLQPELYGRSAVRRKPFSGAPALAAYRACAI